jgi:glucoamylase
MVDAPGFPGIPARWTSSAKDGVGTALSPRSTVWFTISHGILNEIYYPCVDTACTRDMELIVTDGTPGGFFAEEKRDTLSRLRRYADGVPLFHITNTHKQQRFSIMKEILADPRHDCVLQRIRLIPGAGGENLRLFVLLAPHLVNGGANNTGWIEDYKGRKMLVASGDGTALALACSTGFLKRSVGFAGTSDGYQTLHRDGQLTEQYDLAADGNIALCGEINPAEPFMLALGFGRDPAAAAFQAVSSLEHGYDRAQADYAANWQQFQQGLQPLDVATPGSPHNFYRISTSILRCHESPLFPGGTIASLSIPWGASKGDDDIGGYHLVWPRDLVETAGAMLACGAKAEARRTLDYLRVIQEAEGDWRQNTWLDGTAYWAGTQMDETAFPVLLLDLAFRHGAVPEGELAEYWPMARRACAFIVQHGPSTGQDRWEENSGYTPATIAVEIAALLAAADIAIRLDLPKIAAFLRDTADAWNADLDRWLYVAGTELAKKCGVDGYYVRIVDEGNRDLATAAGGEIQVKNRPAGQGPMAAEDLVGPDAVALVRLGLRSAHDKRIRDTLRVIDYVTMTELPQGPGWHRYNHDGYGEKEDGGAFDGTGIGRVWPLLTGERAHCAIAAGDLAEARRLRAMIEGSTSPGGMMPEQVWDTDDIPARELYRGKPSGSAMPLVWAHAEYIKLLRSLRDGVIFDLPPQTVQRYIEQDTKPRCRDWREEWWRSSIPAGQILRVQLTGPGTIRWSTDAWQSFEDVTTEDIGLGLNTAELPSSALPEGSEIEFTWMLADRTWRGRNFNVTISPAPTQTDRRRGRQRAG